MNIKYLQTIIFAKILQAHAFIESNNMEASTTKKIMAMEAIETRLITNQLIPHHLGAHFRLHYFHYPHRRYRGILHHFQYRRLLR